MSVECAECEQVVYAGHAPSCSRRCQSGAGSAAHCERAAGHPDRHQLFCEDSCCVVAEWDETAAGRMDLQRTVCGECFTERSVTGACMCEQVTA